MVCKFCFNSHSNSINVLLHALDAHKRNVGGIQHEKKVLLLLKRGVDDDVLNVSISGFYFKSPSRSQESRYRLFLLFSCVGEHFTAFCSCFLIKFVFVFLPHLFKVSCASSCSENDWSSVSGLFAHTCTSPLVAWQLLIGIVHFHLQSFKCTQNNCKVRVMSMFVSCDKLCCSLTSVPDLRSSLQLAHCENEIVISTSHLLSEFQVGKHIVCIVVNFVNRLCKNPKHITAITFSSKPDIYTSISHASSLAFVTQMSKHS